MEQQALEKVLNEADQLFSEQEIDAALDKIAAEMTTRLAADCPIFLCVLTGAIIPMGRLMCRLSFPLETDYVHATRYQGETTGTELKWKARPSHDLAGRTVVLVDDIFDEGITLEALVHYCHEQGAAKVFTAVLVNKLHHRKVDMKPDFVGLDAEDRYLFGCGMDYKEYWRNAPGIYAVKEYQGVD